MIDRDATLADVCFAVALALDDAALHGVLTGGSAAAMYAPDTNTSNDADFVIQGGARADELERALQPIGFRPSATIGMYVHPETPFTIDFLKGPLAVGGEYVLNSAVLQRGHLRLHILTPTDCVRDRLAHFYFWDDYTALGAAVGVARAEHGADVNLNDLRDWTQRESAASGIDYAVKFAEFIRRRCA